MDSLFQTVYSHLEKGEKAALACIVKQHGSTPRGAGACLARFADGSVSGTVGGGEVEHRSTGLAAAALEEQRAFIKEYSLGANHAASIGMVCGGDVGILFLPLDGSDEATRALFGRLAAPAAEEEDAWLLLACGPQGQGGAHLVKEGTVVAGSGFLPPDATANMASLCKNTPVLRQSTGEECLFSLPLGGQGIVYVFGGGHVAQHLVPALARVDFACHVADDRPEFANKMLFPDAKKVDVVDFKKVFGGLTVTRRDYIVIMTRGHLSDYDLLARALATPARYIGMIGSRRKISTTYTRLIKEEGRSYAEMARVHAPIGLPIGGETPAEIAVSIAAEMIGVRAKPLD